MYREIDGDLIKLALEGKFDVIAHGCNCFCTMGAGIAPLMAKTFYADRLPKESKLYKGNINKLGDIDYGVVTLSASANLLNSFGSIMPEYVLKQLDPKFIEECEPLYIVNAYTQYGFGKNHTDGYEIPLDYDALTMCMRKINHTFKGKHIGLPQIGCGLAGGDWNIVKSIIQSELKNCDVTVVIFKK